MGEVEREPQETTEVLNHRGDAVPPHGRLLFLSCRSAAEMALRVLKEWGANRITGVLPYLAYARQEKLSRFNRKPASSNCWRIKASKQASTG